MKNPKLKTDSINYQTGRKSAENRRDAFDEIMQKDEEGGATKENSKLATREQKAFGRLENIARLEKQLSGIKLGKFTSAIFQS